MMGENVLELKPGDQIGKYVILRMLGKGGIAAVYLAEQRLIKRQVAIKLFTTKDQNLLAAMCSAMESLAALDHPHIIDLYDADEYQDTFYYVERYIEGHTLGDMIASKNELPITVVLKLMICIADALDYAHRLGIVHGDVKPPNILVSSDGNPVLVDFSYPGSFEGHAPATLRYMAPEGWQAVLEARSDLWALGMTLYETLTGHLPFDTRDEQEVRKIVTSPTPLDLGDLHPLAPQPVARIVEHCLEKDLDRRCPSASALRRDLESALAYLESGESDAAVRPLCPGSTILLDVEYREAGIAGQYREFRILEEVGRGNFSVVYRARDVIAKRQVALKILRQERTDDERVLARFRREAGLLARLRHPHIVRGYNFGRYVTDLFIVMEMLSGVTLESALACGFEFAVPYAAAVVAQILAGLAGLHAEGTVHRDIKPANVMLQAERAVVMDMGLAHVSGAEQLTMSGEIFGTPRYMAPEQARGEEVTVRSDLYAAGVILYELLSGQIPHQADTTARLLFKIALEEPEPITEHRRDLPSALVSVLDRMLAREPAHRFQFTSLAYEVLLASVGLREGDLPTVHRQMFDELETALCEP